MDTNGNPPQGRTPEEVQNYIVTYLAEELQIGADSIDVTAPFDQLALDSMTAVGMTGDLERWLGARIDPMAIYDYPTIEQLSTHLAEKSQLG